MANVAFVQSDTGSEIEVTCKDDEAGTAINLTGATVKLIYKIGSGALQTKTMTVTDAVGGVAKYRFLAGELTAGLMQAEVEITDSGGKIITSLKLLQEEVRAKLA